MASKLNTEFNYRYQVIGETVWEKIKTLQGFLEGRIRAAALEEVGDLKYQAKLLELEHLRSINALPHVIMNLQAEILEIQSSLHIAEEAYELNRKEIEVLKKLLAELFILAEPTRIEGYSDEDMYEANAANEFTVTIGKDIQSEIIANGRPSAAKIRNAMSNPFTFNALKQVGLIPEEAVLIEGNVSPLQIELKPKEITDG